MTRYKRGDVVLVEFGFSEARGSKKRPALILSSEAYHRSRQEVIMAAITSHVHRLLFGDTKLAAWKEAGLLFPSVVTAILRTVKTDLILRKLGVLPLEELERVGVHVRQSLGF